VSANIWTRSGRDREVKPTDLSALRPRHNRELPRNFVPAATSAEGLFPHPARPRARDVEHNRRGSIRPEVERLRLRLRIRRTESICNQPGRINEESLVFYRNDQLPALGLYLAI
jgi:hypothetical protein